MWPYCNFLIPLCNGWCNFDISSVMCSRRTDHVIVKCIHNGYFGQLVRSPHRNPTSFALRMVINKKLPWSSLDSWPWSLLSTSLVGSSSAAPHVDRHAMGRRIHCHQCYPMPNAREESRCLGRMRQIPVECAWCGDAYRMHPPPQDFF
jgi:hypothetical protein